MNSILLQLLALSSITIAMPAIDNGMGEMVYGPEGVVTDFAVLSASNFDDNLPDEFTICSSVTTGGAWTGVISPFQLLHENGEPWVSLIFGLLNKTHHEMWLHVSYKHSAQVEYFFHTKVFVSVRP